MNLAQRDDHAVAEIDVSAITFEFHFTILTRSLAGLMRTIFNLLLAIMYK